MDLALDSTWEHDTIVTKAAPSLALVPEDRPTTRVLDGVPVAQSVVAPGAEMDADLRAQPGAARPQSYVGAIPREYDDVWARRHEELALAWGALAEHAEIRTWDGSITAAAGTLAQRVAEVGEACAFLARVHGHANDTSLADLLPDDAPLTAYVAGVYLWLGEVVAALHSLARQLADMTPEWSELRARLEDVRWILDLAERERDKAQATQLAWLPDHVESDVVHLFAAVGAVRAGLEQKFG